MALTCNNENLRPHTDWYTNIWDSFIHSSRVCKEPKCPPTSEGLHQRDMLGTKSTSYRHTCQGSSHSTLPSARAGPPSGTRTSAYTSSVPPTNTKQPPEGRRMGAEWGGREHLDYQGPKEMLGTVWHTPAMRDAAVPLPGNLSKRKENMFIQKPAPTPSQQLRL